MQTSIASIAQATPAWLTQVLHDGGYLSCQEVRSINVTRVHDEQVASVSYFLTVDYGTPAVDGLPTRLFLKLPRPGSDVASAEREVRMYNMFASHQRAVPVVQCFSAQYSSTEHTYHLLLEDLSATHDQPAWHLDIAEHYVTETIDCLAQFHAYWWERTTRPHLPPFLLWEPDHEAELVALRQALPAFFDALGDRLTLADRQLYERTLALVRAPQSPFDAPEHTLLHGDAHFWNFLYPRNPTTHRTRMLDWQNVHVGLGVEDVAYTIVLRYPHRTAANEYALVRRYHAQLLAHGVSSYSWERCWTAYRHAARMHLLSPIRFWRAGLPEDFWGLFVPRILTAVRDLGIATGL